MKFYNALCPYYQNNMIEIRQSEPYSATASLWSEETTQHSDGHVIRL